MRPRPAFALLILSITGCGSSQVARNLAPPPNWVTSHTVRDGRVCGIGVAGRAYNARSEAAKELSTQRAVLNLAGVFETQVEEAQIAKQTESGNRIEFERTVGVAEEMVEAVREIAEAEHWYDDDGTGPFGERGFTYAEACVSAEMAKDKFDVDVSKLEADAANSGMDPGQVPPWLDWIGSQKGARLCAVGFSLPAYHPEETFSNVVEEIRGQLTSVAKTLVMNAFTDVTSCATAACAASIEDLTAATSEAVSKGVVVTHYWHDRDGRGPYHRKRTTYGWGCVYPVEALKTGLAKAKEAIPDEATIAKIRERADQAFEELEKEEFKRVAAAQPPADATPPEAVPAAEPTPPPPPPPEQQAASPGTPES